MRLSRFVVSLGFLSLCPLLSALTLPKPDLTVAFDGTGDFKTVQAAVASIPTNNRQRIVIFIKDGVYTEKVRVDAPFVTLRGQSRRGTRIEFSQLNEAFGSHPDPIGRAVINLDRADDFVLENLSAVNTSGVVGPHAFALYGTGDRTVLVDCDVLSHGADTVSLWLGDRGRYYHARCNFRGSVDFVCPRGWCYVTDCNFYEMKNTAAMWHDGSKNPDMKFVLNDCKFDGVEGWNLARHHHDAQFFFLNCSFSKTMTNLPPFRVIYPDNPQRNADLDKSNVWGERAYFYHCHRSGGDYPWLSDNLSSATNTPAPAKITAAWTFGGSWDPERTSGPAIQHITSEPALIKLTFSEPVTVKGIPRLALKPGGFADYASGSGTDTLAFKADNADASKLKSVDLHGGAIVACEAAAKLLPARLTLPVGK